MIHQIIIISTSSSSPALVKKYNEQTRQIIPVFMIGTEEHIYPLGHLLADFLGTSYGINYKFQPSQRQPHVTGTFANYIKHVLQHTLTLQGSAFSIYRSSNFSVYWIDAFMHGYSGIPHPSPFDIIDPILVETFTISAEFTLISSTVESTQNFPIGEPYTNQQDQTKLPYTISDKNYAKNLNPLEFWSYVMDYKKRESPSRTKSEEKIKKFFERSMQIKSQSMIDALYDYLYVK